MSMYILVNVTLEDLGNKKINMWFQKCPDHSC